MISIYERNCDEHGFHAAQLLLTSEGLRDRKRYLNALNCVNALWSQGNLTIINENDSVSVDELKFGDNDTLAALLAVMPRADVKGGLVFSPGFPAPSLLTTEPSERSLKKVKVFYLPA